MPGPTLTVSHVLDGETLRVHDGRELRLAGILAPRALDVGSSSDKWPSAVAARAELEALALGREVAILYGGGAREDRYGRHAAQGIIRSGRGTGDEVWLQGHLVRQGLARVMTSAQNRTCAAELLAIEADARGAGRGIWAEAAYAVRQASAADTLMALRGTFQIVEGEVAKADGSRLLRIEFADGRRTSLRAVVPMPRGPANATPKRSQSSELTGKRVRVRGFIEERGGVPFLDLGTVGDIEFVSERGRSDASP